MKSRIDRIFSLLVDEIEERMRAQSQPEPSEAEALAPAEPLVEAAGLVGTAVELETEEEELPQEPMPMPEFPSTQPEQPREALLELENEEQTPPQPDLVLPEAPSHPARLMGRLAVGLLVVAVLINIPFNRHGTTLATAMPDSASLVIRDGLVVKEEDEPEIYVFQDGEFRWISSLDAFEHYGYTWGDVHIVEDGYLDRYEKGAPLHVLLKCRQSPHIYRLEEGMKRWIRDIDTFTAEGHVWEDVRFVSCEYLRGLPDGETIPPGSGPPPQP